jgi:hypothetical protein
MLSLNTAPMDVKPDIPSTLHIASKEARTFRIDN